MSKTHGINHWDPDHCFGCKVKTTQFPSFNGPAFQPHFNWSVGKFVNTRHELQSELNRCADRNSEITGTDHKYEMRLPGDTAPIREADGVLDDTARNVRAIKEGKALPVVAPETAPGHETPNGKWTEYDGGKNR